MVVPTMDYDKGRDSSPTDCDYPQKCEKASFAAIRMQDQSYLAKMMEILKLELKTKQVMARVTIRPMTTTEGYQYSGYRRVDSLLNVIFDFHPSVEQLYFQEFE